MAESDNNYSKELLADGYIAQQDEKVKPEGGYTQFDQLPRDRFVPKEELSINIPDLEGNILELSNNPKVLAFEHSYTEAQRKCSALEVGLVKKYKDSPSLENGPDVNGDGYISVEEEKGLSTIAFIGERFVRLDEADKDKLKAFRDDKFDKQTDFLKIVGEEVDKIEPNLNDFERQEIGSAFVRARGEKEKEQGKAQETLKDGEFVPAPKAIDPEAVKAAEAGKQ